MTESQRLVVVSYVPLLTGEPGDVLDATPEGLQSLLKTVNQLPDGSADAMVWALSPEGDPWPVFVMRDAERIFDHLVSWSEETPTRWFDLRMATRGDDYALALVPKVEMSVERLRLAWELRYGAPVADTTSFQVIFKNIHFSSQPGTSTILREVKDKLKPSMKVGFLDAGLFEDVSRIPEDLDPRLIWWAGPFDLQGDKDGVVTSMLPKSKNRLKAERRGRR